MDGSSRDHGCLAVGACRGAGRTGGSYGTLNFFDQTAKHVLDGIKSHRGLAIRPQRTGPVIDVLYSAAGNSADEAYYNQGIIGYDFEIGQEVYYVNPATGVETQCTAGQQPPFLDSTNDCLDNEGFHEAMEFASGNYGLLQSALDYARDTTPPVVNALVDSDGKGLYQVRFSSNEASSIYYTIDGSTPTTASTEYKPIRARALPEPVDVPAGATVKWIAHDFKGNLSAVKSQLLGQTSVTGNAGGSVASVLALTLGAPVSFGAFTPGVTRTYTASTFATVLSTAGNAALTVSDPSTNAPGRLVNETYSLVQPLQVGAPLGALPKTVKTWTAPTSNEVVTIPFSQTINAAEALRAGMYSKTLTFTLSTTTP